jgi:hypothetical protein
VPKNMADVAFISGVGIAGASPLPKGMNAPELFNEAKLIDINKVPLKELDDLPEFLRDKMKSSEEYARIRPPVVTTEKPREYPTDDINPDDIPF